MAEREGGQRVKVLTVRSAAWARTAQARFNPLPVAVREIVRKRESGHTATSNVPATAVASPAHDERAVAVVVELRDGADWDGIVKIVSIL